MVISAYTTIAFTSVETPTTSTETIASTNTLSDTSQTTHTTLFGEDTTSTSETPFEDTSETKVGHDTITADWFSVSCIFDI